MGTRQGSLGACEAKGRDSNVDGCSKNLPRLRNIVGFDFYEEVIDTQCAGW